MKKTQKGITLLALIITIVVLLILALTTIGVVSESGIILNTQNSARTYNEAQTEEKISLAYTEAYTADYDDGKVDGITEESLNAALAAQFGDEPIEAIVDGENISVVLKNSGKEYAVENGKVILKDKDLELVKKYFMGADSSGKIVNRVSSTGMNLGGEVLKLVSYGEYSGLAFIPDPNSITDADTSLTNMEIVSGTGDIIVNITYKSRRYKVTATMIPEEAGTIAIKATGVYLL